MKKTVIGVTPLWDGERDSYWMLPGYLEGRELAGGQRGGTSQIFHKFFTQSFESIQEGV